MCCYVSFFVVRPSCYLFMSVFLFVFDCVLSLLFRVVYVFTYLCTYFFMVRYFIRSFARWYFFSRLCMSVRYVVLSFCLSAVFM